MKATIASLLLTALTFASVATCENANTSDLVDVLVDVPTGIVAYFVKLVIRLVANRWALLVAIAVFIVEVVINRFVVNEAVKPQKLALGYSPEHNAANLRAMRHLLEFNGVRHVLLPPAVGAAQRLYGASKENKHIGSYVRGGETRLRQLHQQASAAIQKHKRGGKFKKDEDESSALYPLSHQSEDDQLRQRRPGANGGQHNSDGTTHSEESSD